MYIDNNNTALGSSVLSETHYCLQAIDSRNTRIIFYTTVTKKQSTFNR